MDILVYYPFTEEELAGFRRLTGGRGQHQIVHARTEEEAIHLVPQAEVLMGFSTPAICAAGPRLRWIQSFSAGMDHYLFPELVASDVVVTNMAGQYASQGAEHAWALLLALSRGLAQAVRAQDRCQWQAPPASVELAGGTLGIVGMGGFGRHILKRAQGYDMEVLVLDPVLREKPAGVAHLWPPTREHLHQLLRRADAVLLACPRTPETYHLIGREEFACMKRTAYLVNVTRGGIVEEAALIAALESGQFAGAGLDVCEQEPLPPDHPLWRAPNLIITAHQAGASQHRARTIYEFFCRNLGHYLKGEPLLNLVDKQRGF